MGTAPAVTQCSKIFGPDQKCENAIDTEGSPKWCKACRAKYHREYVALRGEMKQSRGYECGVTAMRGMLATEFERHGSGSFSGYEIAHLIRQAEAPRQVN